MKKIITYLYLISGSLLTSLLWALQEIKAKYPNNAFINENALWIGLAISGAVLLVGLSYCYWYYKLDKIVQNRWTHTLLRYILAQYLLNDNNTRLTVFKPKIGWKTWIPYLCNVIFGNIVENIKNKKFLLSLYNFPIHGRTIYLQQTDRVLNAKCPVSMTIFRTTVRGGDYNGVADKCYREDRDKLYAHAGSLNGVVIPKEYPEGNDENSDHIRTYMREMNIGREYYDVFRGMNFKTKQVFAFTLRNPDDSIWGIVVVDTDNDFNQSLDDLLKDHIGDYQVMFRSMCETMK